MSTNDCLKEIHAALVAKVKARAAVEGNNKLALAISGEVAAYGSALAAAFGNDGKLDDAEERDLNARFAALVDAHLPARDGTLVDKAWNGFSICFVTVFKGVKAYLNQWFDLGLKVSALALAALLVGCRSENTGVSAAVGDITTLPEISDASDNVSVKVLYMMTGARVWTAKDSNVKDEYRNVYTNDYIGVFHTRGQQDLAVTVEPVAVESDAAESAATAR